MKKIGAMLIACMLLCGCAFAQGEIEIVQQLYTPIEEFEGLFTGYIFAELTNTGDEPIGFEQAVFTVQNAQGEDIAGCDGFLCYPSTIGPGETAYFADYQTVEGVSSAAEMPGHTLEIIGGEPFYDLPTELTVLSAGCVDTIDSWGDQVYRIMAHVKNETEGQIFDPTMTYGVYDADGQLIFAGATTVYYSVLPAGAEAWYCLDIDYAFDQLWRMSGVVPAEVRMRAIVE